MNEITNLNSQLVTSSGLERFSPEPTSGLTVDFKSVLSAVGSLVGDATNAFTGIDPSYVALLNKQIETQQQMQAVSMESNVEKSRHETQMAPIRNIRVG